MKPITQEWIEKAEGDWNAAQSLYRVRKLPNYDMVCFCTQQCAELYLKARLEEANVAFPRTHDLIALLNLVLPIEPNWVVLRPHLLGLNGYSVAVRYPGSTATKISARTALQDCRMVRRVIRLAFNLPV
jgi:HEPN domain-containing protein